MQTCFVSISIKRYRNDSVQPFCMHLLGFAVSLETLRLGCEGDALVPSPVFSPTPDAKHQRRLNKNMR